MVAIGKVSTPEAGGASIWKNSNLRFYFGGQIVSMVGTWMQQMALSWLVYRMTNSVTMLGVVAFATQAPTFFVTPFAGKVTDRVQKHRLVLVTQCLAMLQASQLAALVLLGHPQVWQLISLGVFGGLVNAFDLPSRQTFLVEMLQDRKQLPKVIATNSSIVTLSRLIGPAVAGLFIAKVGEGMCFLINAATYIAVIGALCLIRTHAAVREKSGHSILEELQEGFLYVFTYRPIRSLILLMAAISLVAMPYATLLPAFAKNAFHGNAATFGFLTSAAGIGSFIGALFLSSRKGVLGLGKWVVIACSTLGLGLTFFGLSHSLHLSMLCLLFVGFGSMVQTASCNTLIQTIVDEDKRGRVMSIYTMAFVGLAPFGSLLSGAIAAKIGTGETVLFSGLLTIVLAAAFASKLRAIREEVRPLYIERGILQAEGEMKVLNA
jgi:MFS family permease